MCTESAQSVPSFRVKCSCPDEWRNFTNTLARHLHLSSNETMFPFQWWWLLLGYMPFTHAATNGQPTGQFKRKRRTSVKWSWNSFITERFQQKQTGNRPLPFDDVTRTIKQMRVCWIALGLVRFPVCLVVRVTSIVRCYFPLFDIDYIEAL